MRTVLFRADESVLKLDAVMITQILNIPKATLKLLTYFFETGVLYVAWAGLECITPM